MANSISLSSIDILKEQIAITREELPFLLTVDDLLKILPHGKTKINEMLRRYDYPEAKPDETIPNRKIGGRRVVPRDWFLAWLYGGTIPKTTQEDEYEINF